MNCSPDFLRPDTFDVPTPSENAKASIQELSKAYTALAVSLQSLVPDNSERHQAIRSLEESLLWATKSVLFDLK